MNIPEPEFQLGEKVSFLVRDEQWAGFSREELIEMSPNNADLDIDNPCPVVEKVYCQINGRAYDIDANRWIYRWFPSHNHFPDWEEQEKMGWYPIENYEKVKENEP